MFQTQRIMFDKMAKKYQAYLRLYALWNNGSTEHATTFAEFYWRFSYYVKYEDPTQRPQPGY